MTHIKQLCKFTRKIVIDNLEYEYKCNNEQYCRKLCKAHYKIHTSKTYTVEPYIHNSKEKFYKDIKPLEIEGETNE